MEPTKEWLALYEKVKEKTKSAVDFNKYFEEKEIAGMALDVMNIGLCDLPSGKVIVADPLVYLDKNCTPYLVQAPAGSYQTEVCVVKQHDGDCARYAAVHLRFNQNRAVKFYEALIGSEDLENFEEGEYFVGDLIFAGEIMVEAMDILKPALAGSGSAKVGKMILCTVKDDLHDIGKNIVKAMLEAGGFEVLDLGIDVSPEKVVETAKKENIKIIGLSGVLTLALDSMKDTINAFKEAGMRDDVKIIIGGNPVSEDACKAIGADEWAYSPQKTVKVCTEWAAA